MELHGNRDQLVVATKVCINLLLKQSWANISQYSWAWNLHDQSVKHKINFAGNNTKSMRLSIEASLKKLRTLYVDIFYVHWWDYDTSVEEIMDSLHNLVVQGKVLYLVRDLQQLHYFSLNIFRCRESRILQHGLLQRRISMHE